jgi:hypothetical protein
MLEVHGFPAPEPPSLPTIKEWEEAHDNMTAAVEAMAEYAGRVPVQGSSEDASDRAAERPPAWDGAQMRPAEARVRR